MSPATSRSLASTEQGECSAFWCRPLRITPLPDRRMACRSRLELCRVWERGRLVVAGVVLVTRYKEGRGIMAVMPSSALTAYVCHAAAQCRRLIGGSQRADGPSLSRRHAPLYPTVRPDQTR